MAFLKEEKFETKAVGTITLPTEQGNGLEGPVSYAPMTVNGVVVRTFILLMISAVAGTFGWFFLGNRPELFGIAALLGAGAAIVFGIMASRKPLNAKVPGMLYAAAQGVLVGGISSLMAASEYREIVIQALLITASIVGATLVLYATGIVKVTQKFRTIVFFATAGIFVYYLVAIVIGLFGVQMPLIWDSGPIGILFSLAVIFIASLNLFSDYSIVTEAIENKSDERFEWYAAFGITATVLWIYVEVLRLLSKRN